MRWLLFILLFSRLAIGYPAGVANSVVRVPPAGGPVTTGAVDLTKNAAVTGLSSGDIPYWNGTGANGLLGSSINFDQPNNRTTFSGPIRSSLIIGPAMITNNSSGDIIAMGNWVAGASTFTICTTSPCPLSVQRPSETLSITNVTRSAVGTYQVNFTAAYWSTNPVCIIVRNNTPDGRAECVIISVSTTAIPFVCRDNPAVFTDAQFTILCVGRRS